MKFRTAYGYLSEAVAELLDMPFNESEDAIDMYREKYASPSGEKIVYEHREEITKEGKRNLIKDRKVNIYEKIQASKESCEIENILRRAAEGDMSVLNAVQGNYIDVTGAPKTLAEAQQLVIRTKNEFEKLPKDIKVKFENNAEMYVAEFGTESWLEKTGLAEKYRIEEQKKIAQNTFQKNIEKTFADLAEKGSVVNE